MSTKGQAEIRHQFLAILLPAMESGAVTIAEAAVACMGAAATCIGCYPTPQARERAAEMLTENLAKHAHKRHSEIISGLFDDQVRKALQ